MASKRPLIWLALASLAPFVGSFALYYWWTPSGGQINYGTLIAPQSFPVSGIQPLPRADAASPTIRGRWLVIVADAPQCDAACRGKLYATRQARMMTGKERDRVVRVWLLTAEGTPDPVLLAEHPDVVTARADPAASAALPADAPQAIYVVDPLGNLILRYPPDPDIKGLNRDLVRLLKASRIG